MDQTFITVLRYSITYYQKNLFICAHYANKHKATALHKAYWLPCSTSTHRCITPGKLVFVYFSFRKQKENLYLHVTNDEYHICFTI